MIKIANRNIGGASPAFIIAELSGNHNQEFERARELIRVAAKCGADAVKLQTYRSDTITLNSNKSYFKTLDGGLWAGQTLYQLYEKAYTPWEWQPELKKYAESLGLICFSSPFDLSAVDFLEEMEVPCYKIASFEINDIQLIEYTAAKGKPMLISTGVATLGDIEEAIQACKRVGNNDIILLKCTSGYPTPLEEVNLATIPHMANTFNVVTGISDHTLGSSVPIAAVTLGAKVIEKHLTLSKEDNGVDSEFSMDPEEFKTMVEGVRAVEKAIGRITYELTPKQEESKLHRRSLFIAKDIKKGEIFTKENVKSVRPAHGLNTKYINDVLGKCAMKDIEMGEPLSWSMIEQDRNI